MPRKGQGPQPTPKSVQANLLWGSGGGRNNPTLIEWDPKQEPLIEAILAVLQSGATLVFRPGSGNRSIGVAIWEGDARHAPKWCYDSEELDEWADWVIEQGRANIAAD